MLRIFCAAIFLLTTSSAWAGTESISVSDLNDAIREALTDRSDLGILIGDRIQAVLDNANVHLDEDRLIYTIDDREQRQLRGGCSANVKLQRVTGTVRLDGDTSFRLVLDALSKPIVVSVDVFGGIDATGRLKARYGVKVLGKCVRYQTDHLTADVSADLALNLTMVIALNPELVNAQTVRVSPEVELSGHVSRVSNTDVDIHGFDWVGSYVIGGLFGGVIINELAEAYGEREAEDLLDVGEANTFLAGFLFDQEESLNQQIHDSLGGESRDYVLPVLTIEQAADVARLVNRKFISRLPAAWEYIEDHQDTIVFHLLTGDTDALDSLFTAHAACRTILDQLPNGTNGPQPLFRRDGSSCQLADPYQHSFSYPTIYSDHSCTQQVPFDVTTLDQFCAGAIRKDWLGNADTSLPDYGTTLWTLHPSTGLDLSAISSIEDNAQPFVRRVNYRTINNITDGFHLDVDHRYYDDYSYYAYRRYSLGDLRWPEPDINDYSSYQPTPRGSGTCKLEMRIYKKEIEGTNLKPLMAIHGGAWRYRGAAFFGMESQISQFTERGFVVFAPFYRLIDDEDGNVECNNATGQDIVADIEGALDWVKAHMDEYGANSNSKISLFGQSAGAHLSTWLVTYRSTDIDRALLMYPPTDAADYVEEYRNFINAGVVSPDYQGNFSSLGVSALEEFLQPSEGSNIQLQNISTTDPFVQANSFPNIIANNPIEYPPVFIIHGRQDSLVPSVQSVRLCNAYDGNANNGPASNSVSSYRQIYYCGHSELQLLQEADHMLELCVPPLRCQAGESQSAREAAESALSDAQEWLVGVPAGAEQREYVNPKNGSNQLGNPSVSIIDNTVTQFCIEEGYDDYMPPLITHSTYGPGHAWYENGAWKSSGGKSVILVDKATCYNIVAEEDFPETQLFFDPRHQGNPIGYYHQNASLMSYSADEFCRQENYAGWVGTPPWESLQNIGGSSYAYFNPSNGAWTISGAYPVHAIQSIECAQTVRSRATVPTGLFQEPEYQGVRLGYQSIDTNVLSTTAIEFCRYKGYSSWGGTPPWTAVTNVGGATYRYYSGTGWGTSGGSSIYLIDSIECYH